MPDVLLSATHELPFEALEAKLVAARRPFAFSIRIAVAVPFISTLRAWQPSTPKNMMPLPIQC